MKKYLELWLYQLIQFILLLLSYFTLVTCKLLVLTEHQLNTLVEQWGKFTNISDVYRTLILTMYLSLVRKKIANGIPAPTMACVDGIPYSSAYRFSSWTTGGEAGRGSLTMSFVACPRYIKMHQNVHSWRPTYPSMFQNQKGKNVI